MNLEQQACIQGFYPISLTCEYAPNPIGITACKPRFSWVGHHEGRGYFQTAYMLEVASKEELLLAGKADLWDTGKVRGNQSVNIEYSGKPLRSCQTCYWRVSIWDNEDYRSDFSEIQKFEMGLLSEDDWKAEWISIREVDIKHSPYFRKSFVLSKKVSKARIYISGLGYYELRVNGQKAGDHVLDPGWTDYSKRVLYAVYDVTACLIKGENVLGVILGNGWHWNPGVILPDAMFKSSGKPMLLLQLDIEFDDGTNTIVASNSSSGWVASTGPILENSIYHGEYYDARLEKSGWDEPGYAALPDEWLSAEEVEGPGGILTPQIMEPIKVVMDLSPVKTSNPENGIFVYDMGQNFAGWVKLRVRGIRGTEVKIRYSELLYDDGTVNQENLRSARATDTYILKGGTSEIYEPRFTYHGFRYVQLECSCGELVIEELTGRVARSSVEAVGTFECSNAMLNSIQKNVVWTEASNLHSIPTDCPQRDERLGWLNDATVRAEEAIYNFNMSRFYSKWLDDIADTQDATGAITNTAPDTMPMVPGVWEHTHADAVCSSYLIIPWLMYLHYGDMKTLERHYEGMKLWTEFLGSKAKNWIVNFSQMGDWASPISQCIKESVGAGAVSANTSGILISTGYYYYNASLISMIAGLLGKNNDKEKYSHLAEEIKKAFNDKFLDACQYKYVSGSQASNLFPLYLGIVPESFKKGVLENAVKDIVNENNVHLTTGNLCSKYILEALSDSGFGDLAFALSSCDTYPSWGYMIKEGATTIWERWEGGTNEGMNSHNHPMYGSISAWFYKHLAGIQPDIDKPGFEKVIIKPLVPENLDYSSASLKTIRGIITSAWKKHGKLLKIRVEIPFNSTSEVYLPKKNAHVRTEVIENGNLIWKDGKLVSKSDGIKYCVETNEFIIFETGSGKYDFVYNYGSR